MAEPSIRQRPRPRADRRGHLDATASHPTAPAAEPAAPRHDARIAAGLNALAGIWLIIAPFVLGYGDGDPYWNDIVFGALVLAIAVLRYAVAPRAAWLSALNMLIGAWIFSTAFWLDSTATASWNDAILGVIVFVLGAIGLFAAAGRPTSRPYAA